MTVTVREVALNVLEKIEKQGAYSQLALNHAIEKAALSEKDVALLTQIVYGTLQRQLTLDYYIRTFVKNEKKMEPWVRLLLRLSFFQFTFLDKVPDHAIVSEAVTIAKKRGHKGIAGLVNGVLRATQRKGLPNLEGIKDPIERLSIETSHPQWLLKRWLSYYGIEATRTMCDYNNTAPLTTLRVNALKMSRDEALAALLETGLDAEKGRLSDDALILNKGKILSHPLYKEGKVTIQDESSMLVNVALAPQPMMRILDACAGPGGKTTHIAEKMADEGDIIALDIHQHKTKLIEKSAARLDLRSIHTHALDARSVQEAFEPASFDCILVDAPCTGFGVIRRKPEIKYQKTVKDIEQIAEIQTKILAAVAPLLKKGGKLVYSTCTVDKEENVGTAERFLQEFTDFEVDHALMDRLPQTLQNHSRWYGKGMVQILPQDFDTDGFFISCFVKK
ncbi:ribosomal RNA small subunit methyltransferase B [Pullulanibacillus camelliae]|uniref:16S rRNA (cytosine(967)-C(5))-methyltransferase n=1 Tax=Pullulanibacillus camelliae TaxID=1707096 RepID=A0A8J2VWP2_9BACL|nr:16S rRNA (cytosine(967)-C(5))-methyltransferase RsmB [Pullulanibacillus camelliae]GGE41785.1 ribosomal RNA small subunit methyltransferase B [Pullulanibacillus camelliae]